MAPRTLAGLTPWQLGALSGEQLAVLLPDQVAALSTFQVQVLMGTGQLGALSMAGRARLVEGGQMPEALNLHSANAAIQAGTAWAVRQANALPPALLMQLTQDLQFVIGCQSAPHIVDPQLSSHRMDHGRGVPR